MEPGKPLKISSLFQRPNQWTPRHLEGLNIEEHDLVDAAAIVGHGNLPDNGDQCTLSV